jgi:hypothetical protein
VQRTDGLQVNDVDTTEHQNSPERSLAIFASLALIVIGAMILRIPGMFWLVDYGPVPDYSFNTDDQRFVDLAKDFQAGMPDGYVHGMTTHLLGLRALVEPFVAEPNLLQLLKVVTILYAALTALLMYAFAKEWRLGNWCGVLAAFFLATAPMHVALSNFGTADVTAVFHSYLAMLLGAKYLRTRDQLWFVLAAAITGAAIAIKLFLPLLAPLFLLVIVHRGRQLFTQAITAGLVVAGAFEAVSLFSYTPQDLQKLAVVLRDENVSITAGNGPLKQAILYGWDLISAVGLPVAGLLFVAALLFGVPLVRRLPTLLKDSLKDWRAAITPELLLFSGLAAHALLIVSAGIHGARHLFVFVPMACLVAAHTLTTLWTRIRWTSATRWSTASVLLGYCVFNAIAVERLFSNDVRADLGTWVQKSLGEGKKVLTFSGWTPLKGTLFDERAGVPSAERDVYVITCDLEYARYLKVRDAEQVYSAFGGQERLDFFWDTFQGKSSYQILRMFRQRPLSLEQWLIDKEVLRPIGTYVPKKCLALGQDRPQERAISAQEIWPRLYFTAGW